MPSERETKIEPEIVDNNTSNTHTIAPSQTDINDFPTQISFAQGEGGGNKSLQQDTSKNDPFKPSTEEEWRAVVGKGMETMSDAINDNIVAARYATFASIALLSAYGISKTPLFFRYKTVPDIPASHFLARKIIHGRLVRVVENKIVPLSVDGSENEPDQPIVCLVRHLSPSGRLLNRSAFDFFLRASPAAAVGKRLESSNDDLLKIEIAGVKKPPSHVVPSHLEQPGEWLNRLAEQRVPITCELLARRIKPTRTGPSTTRTKRDALPELSNNDNHFSSIISLGEDQRDPENQTAVARIRYRPGLQIFRTDVASALVRYGRASVYSGLYVPDESTTSSAADNVSNRTTVDCSTLLANVRKDATYLEELGKAEIEAVKESRGMWADPNIRESRKDLVEEATFEATATLFQRVWRWLRG